MFSVHRFWNDYQKEQKEVLPYQILAKEFIGQGLINLISAPKEFKSKKLETQQILSLEILTCQI